MWPSRKSQNWDTLRRLQIEFYTEPGLPVLWFSKPMVGMGSKQAGRDPICIIQAKIVVCHASASLSMHRLQEGGGRRWKTNDAHIKWTQWFPHLQYEIGRMICSYVVMIHSLMIPFSSWLEAASSTLPLKRVYKFPRRVMPVSYTHLTLPTIYSV